MAIVVEDGTNVANANSFVTLAEYTAWADDRGINVPPSPASEQNLIKATDYINTLEPQFSGERLYDDQPLAFPRTLQYIHGILVADGNIPKEVKVLQYTVAYALSLGIELFPMTGERAVKRKKVGPLETEWFDNDISPTLTMVDAAAAPLLSFSGAFALTVRRV